jgi:hypothetical protein
MEAPRRPGLRRIAVLTALVFGCATTRVPVSSLGEPAPVERGAIAEPQLELWVEGGEAISPADKVEALERSRAALAAALEGRGGAAEGQDLVLYVRERAVARTDGRRHDQALAVTGIVVGAVVIAAVVVLAVVAGGKGGGGSLPKGGGSGPKLGSHGSASAPVPIPAPPRVVTVPVPTAVPVPRVGSPRVVVNPPNLDVWVGGSAQPSGGAADVPPPPDAWGGPADPWQQPPPDWGGPPSPPTTYAAVSPGAAPQPVAPPRRAIPVPALPPAAPLEVATRGFFAGDEVIFDLVVVDRATGQALWSKSVHGEIDPRDAHAVGKLLDEALEGVPWASR